MDSNELLTRLAAAPGWCLRADAISYDELQKLDPALWAGAAGNYPMALLTEAGRVACICRGIPLWPQAELARLEKRLSFVETLLGGYMTRTTDLGQTVRRHLEEHGAVESAPTPATGGQEPPAPAFRPGQWVKDKTDDVGIVVGPSQSEGGTDRLMLTGGGRGRVESWHTGCMHLTAPDAHLVFPNGLWPDMRVRVCENPVDEKNEPLDPNACFAGSVGVVEQGPYRNTGHVRAGIILDDPPDATCFLDAHNLRPVKDEAADKEGA